MEAFFSEHADKTDGKGRKAVVQNGYPPARTIMTAAGRLEIKQSRVRDRTPRADERVVFGSAILLPYRRKSQAIEELVPWLCLPRSSPPGTKGRPCRR